MFNASCRWWDKKVNCLNLKAPMTVLPEVSCQDAVEIMDSNGYDQLPVIDEAGFGIDLSVYFFIHT